MESLKTIFQATLFSLFAGGGLGLIGGIAVYYLARLEAKSMNPWQAASYMCSAGNAAFTLVLLAGVAGVATGFMVGVTIAIARKADETQSAQFTLEK
jgi:hypothetical protein